MSQSDFKIRRQEPKDAEALHAVYSQPKVIAGTTMLPYPALHQWEKAVDEPKGMTRLVVCVDDAVVGNIALTLAPSARRRHSATVAMAVHDDWQGQGLGYGLLSEALQIADNWMDLRRIELEVFTDNDRGVRLYERCGFEVEGTFRNYAYRNGQYADVYAMARLR